MTTELSTINQDELNAFIAQTKSSSDDLNGGGNFLPQLKVNYMDEVEIGGKKIELKPGLFTITIDDTEVFAKNVRFRPLLHNYQYINYNKDEEKVVNRSVLFNDFKDEARDEQGTLRCGKPPSKVIKDNPALKEQYKNINLYRSIDGLVTFIDGKDALGNPVEVKDVLCTFRGKGSNFSPFQEEYTQQMPKGSLIWDYELLLSTTKHKQDPKSAVSYFIVHFEADFAKKLVFTPELFATVKELKRRIDETNAEIDRKYYSALEAKREAETDDLALRAIDVTPLKDDFDDDIPF